MKEGKSWRGWLGLAVLLCSQVYAAGIQVGGGSLVHWGDARIQLDCGDLVIDGQANGATAVLADINDVKLNSGGVLNAENATIILSGDFEGAGAFNPGTGNVNVTDGCSNTASHIGGSFAFNNLSVTTSSGKSLNFDAGKTTTVNGKLTLKGTDGNLLKIRSTTAGTPAKLAATVDQDIGHVDVADSRGTAAVIAPDKPAVFHSVAGGNIYRWFFFNDNGQYDDPKTHVIPTLSWASLAALAALLAMLGRQHLIRRQTPRNVL